MAWPPIIRPHVNAQPTLDTAIWFSQLRWVAVAGQLLTMAVVAWGLSIKLPAIGLLILVGVTASTNCVYWLWLLHLQNTGLKRSDRLPAEHVITALMLTDILVLSGMLYLSAGIANPFALFYFVNIAVAAAIVTPAWAWAIWATTVGGVTLLLIYALPMEALSTASTQAAPTDNQAIWSIPKTGFLVSFATCSGVITYFITVLTGELRQRELALKEAEDARLRNRQLEGLATLAAGAAHELASPLSTIAVVAKELSRVLDKSDAPDMAKQDVVLIRSELDQCRLILDRMTSAAGEAAGERLRSVSIDEFVDETLVGIRQPDKIEVRIRDNIRGTNNLLPVQAAAQAVRNLLQNGLDASADDQQGSPNEQGSGDDQRPVNHQSVVLMADLHQQQWRLQIVDRGEGMKPEVLRRIGEPFFTTKEPGRGMGLGLYLTENVIRRLGGTLHFRSQPGQGTTAEVLLPTNRD